MPFLQSRQLEATALVWDGQSLILSGGYSTYSDISHAGGGRGEPRGLLVIITPAEVDSAGRMVVARDEPSP